MKCFKNEPPISVFGILYEIASNLEKVVPTFQVLGLSIFNHFNQCLFGLIYDTMFNSGDLQLV